VLSMVCPAMKSSSLPIPLERHFFLAFSAPGQSYSYDTGMAADKMLGP
jgi:hypothetical protein